MQTTGQAQSEAAYAEASEIIPGGVNSSIRAFGAVGGTPPFIVKGHAAHIVDLDDNEYIDYMLSYGSLILGHADGRIVAAIHKAAAKGCSFAAPTVAESRLARIIVDRVPSIDMVRLVSSGAEAVMCALRLARGHTGRDAIVKFDGCYHGHVDALLTSPGAGEESEHLRASAGVPSGVAADTVVAPYNDIAALEAVFSNRSPSIAAVIVEPIPSSMGLVPPAGGFLAAVRELCDRHAALLIFDELTTGFRVAPGGAQALCGVSPDLTCLGKVLGGGLPLAAYGGPRRIMQHVATVGDVYHGGVLAGNPVAVAAGLATLEAIDDPGIYESLDKRALRLHEELRAAAQNAAVAVHQTRVGSMMSVFFTDAPVTDLQGATACNTARFAEFFHAMLRRGIHLPPSPFECLFVSTAHTDDDIDKTIEAAGEAFREVA